MFFFDGNTITLNSLIGDTYNTASATNLGSWIGSNDGYVSEWIGQSSSNIVNTNFILIEEASLRPKIITSGVIDLKNSKPFLNFLPTEGRMVAPSLSTLNDGNSFTMLTVSHSNSSANTQGMFVTGNVNYGFRIFNDRTATKAISFISSTGGTRLLNLITQQNNDNNILLTNVMTPTTLEAYFNGVTQETNTKTGTYDNTTFKIGSNVGNSLPLNGGISEIIIYPSDKSIDLSEIHTDINSYYSIY